MARAILPVILARPKQVPKPLYASARALEKAYAEWRKADTEWEKAYADWRKAYAEREKAYAEWRKANAEREKANAEFREMLARYASEIQELEID